MSGTKFSNLLEDLEKVDSVDNIRVLDKKIPIGKKNGVVCYRNRKCVKIKIDFTKDVTWLDDLGDNLTIEIGDTFYNKKGSEFKYDYLRQSHDYNSNLDLMVEKGDVYIMIDNGLKNGGC
jgi:hypothetical protein